MKTLATLFVILAVGLPVSLAAARQGPCQPAWLPTFGDDLNGPVRALAVFDDGSGGGPALYVAGEFTAVDGVVVNHIAAWNGSSWKALGSGMDGTVASLEVFDDGNGAGPALYAGGLFSTAGGIPSNGIAKWNGSAWSSVGGGVIGGFGVFALEVFDDGSGPALYAGGFFSSPGNNIARWDGSSWSALGSGLTAPGPGVPGVYALEGFDAGGPHLYAGGVFFGNGLQDFAKWDGTAWSTVGAGSGGSVYSMTVHDDGAGPALYAGGNLFGGYVRKWDGATWSSLGRGVSGVVQALATFDDGGGSDLVVGGAFTTAGTIPVENIAEWDGTQWSALGGGLSGGSFPVSEFTVFDDGRGGGPALYAGGGFLTSSTGDRYLARWGCLPSTEAPWIEDFDDPGAYSPGQDPTNPSTKGWESWDLEPLTGSEIRTTRSRSAPHSLFIGGKADTIQRLNATSGKLGLVSHVFVPTQPGPDRLTRQEWWIVLNTYNHNGPKNTSLQFVLFANGRVGFEGGPNAGQTFPGFPDQWAEIRAEIDLDTDTCQVFYGLPGATIPVGAPFPWSGGVTGNGARAVAGLDLWANNQSLASNPTGGVYFDDLAFVPEPLFGAFCTAKSQLLCGPASISASGTPSATAASGFVVEAKDVRGCRAGLLLYSNQPVQPGVSFGGTGNGLLCLSTQGVRRAGPIESGGTSPQFCDGVLSIDMNRFHTLNWSPRGCNPAQGQSTPAGFLSNMGVSVNAQIWGRDSIMTGQVLSDGISWSIGP